MLGLQKFLSKKSAGLDIHSGGIRLLQLRRNRQDIVVERVAVVGLPPGAVMDGKILQPEVITAHLQDLVQDRNIHGAKVHIALPAYCVISKKIPQDEMMLFDNINHYFPGVSDELAYDYLTLGHEFLLIATRLEALRKYVNVVSGAGLKVVVVDVDLFALVRAANFSIPHKIPGQSIVLVEVNHLGCQLILFNQQEILYHHMLYGSLSTINKDLKKLLELQFLKKENVNEMEVYFMGDHPDLFYLLQYLAEESSLKSVVINPFDSIFKPKDSDIDFSSEYFVCCGLALRGLL